MNSENNLCNTVLENIAKRHSTRAFLSEPISNKDVESILVAGTQAPSAENRQPWRFLVVKNPEVRSSIARALVESLDSGGIVEQFGLTSWEITSIRNSAFAIEKAPVLVLVYHYLPPESLGDYGFLSSDTQSIGACLQNMCLAAHSLGVASLWLCDVLYSQETINTLVGVSDHKLIAALVLGYENPAFRRHVAHRRSLENSIIGVL